MGGLWVSTLAGLLLTVACFFIGQPWAAVSLGVGIFLLSGGLVGLLIQPFTRPGAVTFEDHGHGHGHGGHGGHGGGHH